MHRPDLQTESGEGAEPWWFSQREVVTPRSALIPPTDGEGPGQRHLTQAADLQSQQERRGAVRVPGDASQLRGDRGVQSPGLAEGQHHRQTATTTHAPQGELPPAPDRQEAQEVQLGPGPRQHELGPEGHLHLQLPHRLQTSQTQPRLR